MSILEVRNLYKSYGQTRAVDGISFTLEAGDILGLLGPNGAGKSTAISTIATLLAPDAGDVLFDGVRVADNPAAFRRKLGIVPQDIALYANLSGYDNLRFFAEAYGLSGRERKRRIAKVADIIGIDKRLGDKVKTYSGGMKRRINIGAALLHEPALLIMDEPTVGIDPQSRNHILDTVRTLNDSGLSVLYTSHYMEEVEYLCRQVEIMDKGRIIASGTKEELVTSVGVSREIRATFSGALQDVLDDVRALPYVRHPELTGGRVRFSTDDGDDVLSDLAAIADRHAVRLTGFELEEPTLETVFLHLTGKALRD